VLPRALLSWTILSVGHLNYVFEKAPHTDIQRERRGFHPLAFSSNPIDWSLIWHLCLLLRLATSAPSTPSSFNLSATLDFADREQLATSPSSPERGRTRGLEASGSFSSYGDIDGSTVEERERRHVLGHSPTADLLTCMYAAQLEGEGMIQEACFVLEHLEASAG
jgi:nuclear pore complex protein Nup98-Nup96